MTPFTVVEGCAAPIMQNNIDTDLIIRIERISKLKRGQFAAWAFETLRYLPDGSENEHFILNQGPFRKAKILLAGANFGCGSSREMAVWSIEEFGIRCIIAPSYGDIFYGNCLQNGILPITLERGQIDVLVKVAATGVTLTVDLQACRISTAATGSIEFTLPDTQREALLNGLDEITQTLNMAASIDQFQQKDRHVRPWVYAALDATKRTPELAEHLNR
jgi:3-isopropylmalate/(R)-2-methylmalate dehydratase small subunit